VLAVTKRGSLVEFRNETELAIEAVSLGLRITTEHAATASIASKGGRDLVTDADLAVEDAVRALLGSRQRWSVRGEERGGDVRSDASYWLVDPICGTRNYASGLPLYCVNIALVERGAVTIGVVGNGTNGEVLVAERGRGAWLNGNEPQRLSVSSSSQTIIIEDGKSHGLVREHAARFVAAALRADQWDFRSYGTSLSLALVAAGRTAAYVAFLITDVHAAAGVLVAEQAGAIVTNTDGQPWSLASESIVAAASKELHGTLLELCVRTAR
jgi:fructose-1,6-bisphosphatase/inositol monophosphatase family enzyme